MESLSINPNSLTPPATAQPIDKDSVKVERVHDVVIQTTPTSEEKKQVFEAYVTFGSERNSAGAVHHSLVYGIPYSQ